MSLLSSVSTTRRDRQIHQSNLLCFAVCERSETQGRTVLLGSGGSEVHSGQRDQYILLKRLEGFCAIPAGLAPASLVLE